MPSYPQQQHDPLHGSWGQRKHLNLLLFDKLEDIEEIYAGTEKPSLRGGRTKAEAIMQRNRTQQATAKKEPEDYATTPKEFCTPAPRHLTVDALQTMKGGGSPQSPASSYGAGGGFSPTDTRNVGFHDQTYEYPPQSPYSSKPPTPASQQFQDTMGQTAQGSPQYTQTTSTQNRPPPWLMPWQTGDRETGRKLADAVRKNRTPIGAFANLDLAKAVK